MILDDALTLLEKGEVVCREVWSIADGYLVFLPGMKHVWKVVIQPANAGNYIFSVEDLRATDWKKFEAPQEELTVIAEEPIAA